MLTSPSISAVPTAPILRGACNAEGDTAQWTLTITCSIGLWDSMEINITRDYVSDIFEFTDDLVDEKLTT